MHQSVLKEETINSLPLKEDAIIVDATLGYAGHSSEILKRIPKGFLYAFDQDQKAVDYSLEKLEKIGSNFEIIKTNFVHMKEELEKRNITKVDGILFDLGVSSPQLDEQTRGFSFHMDAPLDMRMNEEASFSAKDVVNSYSKEELIRIFREYGEEKYASSIAQNIVKKRKEKIIETTLELVEIIKESVPEKYKREKHPARKLFQAIRIEVNDELRVFENALRQAFDLIDVHGRICTITFHSLEDRICKNLYKEVSTLPKELQKMPIVPEELKPKFAVIQNVTPTDDEILENHRSRSSRLRVIERIKEEE